MLFQFRASVEDCGSTLKQHWVNAMCLRKVYSRPSDGLVLGQRRRLLTGNEPAMDEQGRSILEHSWYEVHRRQVLNEC